MTRKPGTLQGETFKEPSLLEAFSEARFHTVWLSNQLAVEANDSPISVIAYEADEHHFFNPGRNGTYDGVLVEGLRRTIAETPGDLFIVLHTMGSHSGYPARHPPAFNRFHPSQSDEGDAPMNIQLLNSYDNTIAYTDEFLADVAGVLRLSGAVSVMYYVSDHGEDIPDAQCKLRGHGNPSLPDFIVPAVLWYSEAYAGAFPERLAALRLNATRAVTIENTFETFIDMAGLDFPSHDRTWSLASPTLRERQRLVNAFGIVDFDRAEVGKGCPILMTPLRDVSQSLAHD
jgi:glucan phosphoethanolaminetransferase (alkaline phosphatase superfamily)